MKITAFNGRGLGNGPAMNGLLNIQKKEEPDVLFVCETKLVEANVEWLRWKLNVLTGKVAVWLCFGKMGSM
jgi:exonuclease III